MRIDTIPANATILHNVMNAGIQNSIVVEAPDPTPPAPKMIVFVADGEPRVDSGAAEHWLDSSGTLCWCGTNNKGIGATYQHYRQLPAEDTPTEEEIQAVVDWASGGTVWEKFKRIIAAMESKEKQC